MTPNRVNRAPWPTKENKQHFDNFFDLFRSMEKMVWDGLANPDLADMLGRTDLDCDHFHFGYFLDSKLLDFQVAKFPKSGPWLGQARLEPSGPKTFDFLL